MANKKILTDLEVSGDIQAVEGVFTGDVNIQGDLTVNGNYTQIDTDVNTTEQWLVTNDGTGPAAIINQIGVQDIFDVQDDGTSVFYIEDGGNVGIGTTSPSTNLAMPDNYILGLGNSTDLRLYHDGSNSYINDIGTGDLIIASSKTNFQTGGANRMVIGSSGKVGIGTTTPSEKLEVNGNILADNLSGTNTGDQDLSGYALTSAIPTNTNFVDLTSAQTVGGVKTFTDEINFDNVDNSIGFNVDGQLVVYGDLALRLETADGIVVNLDDTASITGTTALSINGGGLNMANITGSKTFTFPNVSGTVALTSDIPTNTSFVDLTTNQSINGIKTFEDDIKMYEGKSLIFDSDGDEFSYIKLNLTSSNNVYAAVAGHHFINGDGGAYEAIKAGSFIKDGGTSSQFLKADGSVDSSTYLTSGSTQSKYLRSDADDTTTGTLTATNFILSSDSRLKENVEEVDNKSINVDWKTFEMKSNKGQKRYGVIAQELEEVHPEFVRTDDEGMKSVAYVDLLIAKIAELEARLAKLEK
jgi:hypothetical protein